MTTWAPMNGWRRRGDGWFTHPEYAGWLRTIDGCWYAEADISEGKIEMTPTGPRVVPGWFLDPRGKWVRESSDEDVVIDELRRRLGKVTDV